MKPRHVISIAFVVCTMQLCAACDSIPSMTQTFNLATLTDSTRFRPGFEFSTPGVYSFGIFDSRGQQVFSTDIPEQGWNGLRNNRKENCPDGVYVWRISCSWTGDSVNVVCSGEVTCINMSTRVNVTALDTITCRPTIWVPNAFTPNGDGMNDQFIPVFGCLPVQYNLWIYDRWGNLMFETKDPTKGWDTQDKNGNAPMGTYMWKIKCMFYEGDKERQFTGDVTVIR